MRALIPALLIWPTLALADMADDAAEVAALARSGPPLGQSYLQNMVTVFDNGFGGSLDLDGCTVTAIRRDTGTRDDTIVSRVEFGLMGLDLDRSEIRVARDAVSVELVMRPGQTARAAHLDTSVSAALTDKVAGGYSYVVREVDAFNFRLEGTNDRTAAERLIAALAQYQSRYCAP